jgi:pimeloyl-ACP methyl ester carboxylesterase
LTDAAHRDLPRAESIGSSPLAPLELWQVRRGTEPPLDVYLARAEGTGPLVVFVQGSRVVPLFELIADAGGETTFRSALPFALPEVLSAQPAGFHLAFLERRGLRSFDVAATTAGEAPRSTTAGVPKPNRVSDVADAVLALAAEKWVSEILLVGHSEGADVAAGVAKLLGPRIAAVALLAGAGPSQLFDFVAAARRKADDEGVRRTFEEILWLTSPAASGDYRGLPVERWTTFALDSTPLDDLQGSAVPVFVAHGTADDAASVESADVFVVELLRQNRGRPVFYLVLPGLNHRFVSADGRSWFAEVLGVFLKWARGSGSRRAMQVGLGTATGVRVGAPRRQ